MMANKNALIRITFAPVIIISLFIYCSPAPKTMADKNDVIYSIAADIAAEEFRNLSNVVLCEMTYPLYYEIYSDSNDLDRMPIIEFISPSVAQARVLEILRGKNAIDSLIYFSWVDVLICEGQRTYEPSFNRHSGSKWIIFLDSPFTQSCALYDSLIRQNKESISRGFLTPRNYFMPHEIDLGAFCVYFPKDAKYPPQYVYSERLVDDFRTIVNIQDNPELISDSPGSYNKYYKTLKDKLGKLIFARLFGRYR
jgi:hypothetical protein